LKKLFDVGKAGVWPVEIADAIALRKKRITRYRRLWQRGLFGDVSGTLTGAWVQAGDA